MIFVFLSEKFYIEYNEVDYPEFERKSTRPYIMVKINIDGLDFGIPLRSNINHKNVFWTNKEEKCGVDYSKAVFIKDQTYIDNSKKPYIRPDEFEALRGKNYIIKVGFEKYIKDYKKAFARLDIPRNKIVCEKSTLQYYHKELKIIDNL